jgi:hypothetical protein
LQAQLISTKAPRSTSIPWEYEGSVIRATIVFLYFPLVQKVNEKKIGKLDGNQVRKRGKPHLSKKVVSSVNNEMKTVDVIS